MEIIGENLSMISFRIHITPVSLSKGPRFRRATQVNYDQTELEVDKVWKLLFGLDMI